MLSVMNVMLSCYGIHRVSNIGQTEKVKIKKNPLKPSVLEKNFNSTFLKFQSIHCQSLQAVCFGETEVSKTAKSISSVDSKYWSFLPEKDKTFWDLPYFLHKSSLCLPKHKRLNKVMQYVLARKQQE